MNPHFNHYLFECIGVLIKSTCTGPHMSAEASMAACNEFEGLLFPPINAILANNVEEFFPYAFQILAHLLASRPSQGLSTQYLSLFVPLLSPALWERKGNVPALTSLFRAYVAKGMQEIIGGSHLQGVLGVFQKLLASKSTEVNAFELINALFMHSPLEVLQPFLVTIFNLMLHRMETAARESKTTRYSKQLLHSFCVFSAMYSSQTLFDTFEGISKGLISMVVLRIWEPNRDSLSTALTTLEVKHMVLGGTKLLLESPACQSPEVFPSLLKSLVTLLDPSRVLKIKVGDDFLEDENSREFDTAYCKLAHAALTMADPVDLQVPSTAVYFAKSLASFCEARHGQYMAVIQNCLTTEEATVLQSMLQQAGVRLA